jgi:hypothetical protein
MRNVMARENGIQVEYETVPGEPATRYYPGSKAYIEIYGVYFRNRNLVHISNRNLGRLVEECKRNESKNWRES